MRNLMRPIVPLETGIRRGDPPEHVVSTPSDGAEGRGSRLDA
jgi:hypothetical protein